MLCFVSVSARLATCPIALSSKRQAVRATSTCEAEYIALFDATRITQSQGYLDWFLEQGRETPLIFGDNQSSLALSKSSMVTKRSKHIHLRCHVVRDFAKYLAYCPTDLNRADPLTKPLAGPKYIGLFRVPTKKEVKSFENSEVVEEKACFARSLNSCSRNVRTTHNNTYKSRPRYEHWWSVDSEMSCGLIY